MNSALDPARLHLIVRGRVQGVFFRAATVDEARALGLGGWVRNRPDHSVEVMAEGRRANLEMLAAWAHQGPPAATVDEVEVEWFQCRDEFSRFEIRR